MFQVYFTYWPVVVQMTKLVCQTLQVIGFQTVGVIKHVVICRVYCTLAGILTYQEKVIPRKQQFCIGLSIYSITYAKNHLGRRQVVRSDSWALHYQSTQSVGIFLLILTKHMRTSTWSLLVVPMFEVIFSHSAKTYWYVNWLPPKADHKAYDWDREIRM